MIIRLMGGFGNQLFQYAYGRRLGIEHEEPLIIDTSSFFRDKLRKYELNNYSVQGTQRLDLRGKICNIIYMVQHKFFIIQPLSRMLKMEYERKEFIYQGDAPSNSYIIGYWQNVMYFQNIKHILQQEIVYKGEMNEKQQNMRKDIENENSVAIHVRKGDYLNPVQSKIYEELSNEYYENAIKYLEDKLRDIHIYFFSDDIEWCKKTFLDKKNITFIDETISGNQYIDFELMRSCKHFIIANSTFSWWAAYLSTYEYKICIAPKTWFIDGKRNEEVQNALLQDMILL